MNHELDEGLVEAFCPAFDDVGVLPLLSNFMQDKVRPTCRRCDPADGGPQKDAQRDGRHARQTAHQLALQDGGQQKVVLQQQLEAAREEPEEPR